VIFQIFNATISALKMYARNIMRFITNIIIADTIFQPILFSYLFQLLIEYVGVLKQEFNPTNALFFLSNYESCNYRFYVT